jgi:hypothetical protein
MVLGEPPPLGSSPLMHTPPQQPSFYCGMIPCAPKHKRPCPLQRSIGYCVVWVRKTNQFSLVESNGTFRGYLSYQFHPLKGFLKRYCFRNSERASFQPRAPRPIPAMRRGAVRMRPITLSWKSLLVGLFRPLERGRGEGVLLLPRVRWCSGFSGVLWSSPFPITSFFNFYSPKYQLILCFIVMPKCLLRRLARRPHFQHCSGSLEASGHDHRTHYQEGIL